MGLWSYAYDALGNLTRQTDARGQRICLYYDPLNRLTGKHYRADDNCPNSPTYNVSYGYCDHRGWHAGSLPVPVSPGLTQVKIPA